MMLGGPWGAACGTSRGPQDRHKRLPSSVPQAGARLWGIFTRAACLGILLHLRERSLKYKKCSVGRPGGPGLAAGQHGIPEIGVAHFLLLADPRSAPVVVRHGAELYVQGAPVMLQPLATADEQV